MVAVPVNSKFPDLDKVKALYLDAFPENERSPFELLLDDSTNCSEIFAFYDKDVFCGFMSLLTLGDISHIIYFAIVPSLRGAGYGSGALALLGQLKPSQRLLADIEAPVSTAENRAQREKRKQFYLSNGYTVSGVTYDWQGEDYEILVSGGALTPQEFWDFWDEICRVNSVFAKF